MSKFTMIDSLALDVLKSDIVLDKAYVLLIGGREHNVCVTSIGAGYIFGRVAINKVLLLIDRKGSGNSIAKVVLPQDEKSAVGPGDELFHSVPVVTASPFKIRLKVDAIDIIEDPWRTFLSDEIVSQDGKILDEEKLLDALPSLSGYYVKDRGFVRNPDVWLAPKVELRLT